MTMWDILTVNNPELHSDKEDDSRGVEFVDDEVEQESELIVEDKIEQETVAEPTENDDGHVADDDDIVELDNEHERAKAENEAQQIAVTNDDLYEEHEDDDAVVPHEDDAEAEFTEEPQIRGRRLHKAFMKRPQKTQFHDIEDLNDIESPTAATVCNYLAIQLCLTNG